MRFDEEPNTIYTANKKLDIILGQFEELGGVDFERDRIEGIRKRLNSGEITPDEAVAIAIDVKTKEKQDYR